MYKTNLTYIRKGFAQVVIDGKVVGAVLKYLDPWGRTTNSWEPILYRIKETDVEPIVLSEGLGVVCTTRAQAVKWLEYKLTGGYTTHDIEHVDGKYVRVKRWSKI